MWTGSGKRSSHHPTAAIFSEKAEARPDTPVFKEILLLGRPGQRGAGRESTNEGSRQCPWTVAAAVTISVPVPGDCFRMCHPGALPPPLLPTPLARGSQLLRRFPARPLTSSHLFPCQPGELHLNVHLSCLCPVACSTCQLSLPHMWTL